MSSIIKKKMNKLVAWMIMSVMVLCLGMPIQVANAQSDLSISDVQNHWANKQISEWMDKGLAKGYPDGTFRPNNNITRAEFIALVNKAFHFTETKSIDFTDVNYNDWFYNEIAKAKEAGYISGYADGTIKPNNTISRQEAAVIVARIQNLEQDTTIADNFSDANMMPAWSKESIGAVVEADYMHGYPDGSFRPTKNISRAEAVVTLNNAIGEVTEEKKEESKEVTIKDIDKQNVRVNQTTEVTVKVTPEDAKLTVKSSDETIAKVKLDKNTIKVEGKEKGEATITVTAEKDGYESAKETFTVEVNEKSSSHSSHRSDDDTPSSTTIKYDKAGTYTSVQPINKDVYVTSKGIVLEDMTITKDLHIQATLEAVDKENPPAAEIITLRNLVIDGNLEIGTQVKDGTVILDNVEVKENLTVAGGGANSIHLKNCILNKIVVTKAGVRLVGEGNTTIAEISLDAEMELELGENIEVDVLVLNAPVTITGKGQIKKATVASTAVGSTMETMPTEGLDVQGKAKIEVGGKEIDNTFRPVETTKIKNMFTSINVEKKVIDGLNIKFTDDNIFGVTIADFEVTATLMVNHDYENRTDYTLKNLAYNHATHKITFDPIALEGNAGNMFMFVVTPSEKSEKIKGSKVLSDYLVPESIDPNPTIKKIYVDVDSWGINVPKEGSTTAQYEAAVIDTNGSVMTDEKVSWSINPEEKGITVDENGLVTVQSTATAYDFNLVATSVTDNKVSSNIIVNLYYGTEEAKVTSVEIQDKDIKGAIHVQAGRSSSETYTAVVKDQFEKPMLDEKVTWSIDGDPSADIEISNTGVVTILSSVAVDEFTVVATSVTNPVEKDSLLVYVDRKNEPVGETVEFTVYARDKVDKRLLSGVMVNLNNIPKETTTSGIVTFDNLEEGIYSLIATTDGYQIYIDDNVTVGKNDTFTTIELTKEEEEKPPVTGDTVAQAVYATDNHDLVSSYEELIEQDEAFNFDTNEDYLVVTFSDNADGSILNIEDIFGTEEITVTNSVYNDVYGDTNLTVTGQVYGDQYLWLYTDFDLHLLDDKNTITLENSKDTVTFTVYKK